jgi:hypothetical protein
MNKQSVFQKSAQSNLYEDKYSFNYNPTDY